MKCFHKREDKCFGNKNKFRILSKRKNQSNFYQIEESFYCFNVLYFNDHMILRKV